MTQLYHWLYQLQRHRLAGWTLIRWAIFLLWFLALLAVIHVLPGGLWGAGIWATLSLLLGATLVWARRHLFVHFKEEPPPTSPPPASSLSPEMRVPLRVSGPLEVGEKRRTFVDLPAHFETFASQEKVVAGLVLPSRYLGLGTLPIQEEGMWYQFIPAGSLESLQLGRLHVAGRVQQALRVTFRREGRRETLFLAFEEEHDLWRVWHELADAPMWPRGARTARS